MKALIILVTVFLITGCNTIGVDDVEKATKHCEKHGGLDTLAVDPLNIVRARCKDKSIIYTRDIKSSDK